MSNRWKDGPGSLGLTGPSCIWPFCPPGPPGGGDIGGSGSGHDSADPGTPGSTEGTDESDNGSDNNNDNNDNDDNNNGGSDSNQSQSPTNSDPSSTITSASSTKSSSTSSCSASTIASDCSAICSTAISASSLTCSTTCYSTVTGCNATGSTTTSTISACLKLVGWENVSDGDDFSYTPTTETASVASSTVSVSASATSTASLSTSASSASHISTLVTSTISSPKCSANGAAWFSPTSWCSCAPGATYPTVFHAASATSAMCSYTSLPSSTIQPIQTSAAPTNVPGQGGVDGCVAVEATIGTSAYCDCGGTPAPTLIPKTSGLIDCQYTLQPISSYDPAIPLPSSSSSSLPAPAYATGICTVQVDHESDQDLTNGSVVLSAQISDAENKVIGSTVSTQLWWVTFAVDSLLPYVLEITPYPEQNGDPLEYPVYFAYGAQDWNSDSSQCTYYNSADEQGSGLQETPSYNVNCTFPCPAPSNLKRAAVNLHADSIWSDDHVAQSDGLLSVLVDRSIGNPALSTRTTRSALWTKYASKGAALYKKWQDKQGEDTTPPCDFVNDFLITVPDVARKVRPAPEIQPYLQGQGYGVDKEYYAIGATSPQYGAELVNFQNTMSATQGVFMANDNDRGARPSDSSSDRWLIDFPSGRDPIEWQLSQVAWWMWKRTVALQYESAHGNGGQATDFSKIRSFWRRDIRNADTIALLSEAFAGQDTASTLTWTPDDLGQDRNPFWALLGSPNGNGIQWFLIDNKVALHGKKISEISAVMVEGEGTFGMWATFV